MTHAGERNECMGASYQAQATGPSRPGMQAGNHADARKQHKQQGGQGGRRRAKAHAQAARQARGAMAGGAYISESTAGRR